MGRPLNRKFFGDGASKIACTADIGAGNELCYVVSQRSNTKYAIESEVGPGTRSGVAKLVQGAPAAEGEMQITVTPENAETPRQATVAITAAGGTGALLTVDVVDGGYGYWANGSAVSQAGGDGTIDYTVANGVIVSVSIAAAGAANTDGTVNVGDAPATDPPVQNARIINARTVKTFEGNTFNWPTSAPLGSTYTNELTQANLQSQ